MGMRTSFCLKGSAMAAVALFAVPSFADYIVRDARIEFADGKVIEKGSVWIKGDRIGAVGDVAGAPKEAEVINGTGLTVYPGFADAYSTRGLKLPDAPAAATPPSNTTTAPPTMWDKNRKGIRAQIKSAECLNLSSLLSDTRANGLTEAFLCPGGSMIPAGVRRPGSKTAHQRQRVARARALLPGQ